MIPREQCLPLVVGKNVIGEGGSCGDCGTVLIASHAQLHIIAIVENVVLSLRVRYLHVAVKWRIRHSVHNGKCAAKTTTGDAGGVVVVDFLFGIDDTHTAGIGHAVAQKKVVSNRYLVAVADGYRSRRFKESIAP